MENLEKDKLNGLTCKDGCGSSKLEFTDKERGLLRCPYCGKQYIYSGTELTEKQPETKADAKSEMENEDGKHLEIIGYRHAMDNDIKWACRILGGVSLISVVFGILTLINLAIGDAKTAEIFPKVIANVLSNLSDNEKFKGLLFQLLGGSCGIMIAYYVYEDWKEKNNEDDVQLVKK